MSTDEQDRVTPMFVVGETTAISPAIEALRQRVTPVPGLTPVVDDDEPTPVDIEALLSDARANAREEGRQEGHAAGVEEGHAAGFSEGAQAKADEYAEQFVSHATLVQELINARNGLAGEARTSAIQLAMAMTERLVARRLSDSDVLAARLSEALAAISDGTDAPIQVRAAPLQVEIFRSLKLDVEDDGAALRFVADASVTPGDLIVESHGRAITVILEEQIARLEAVLSE